MVYVIAARQEVGMSAYLYETGADTIYQSRTYPKTIAIKLSNITGDAQISQEESLNDTTYITIVNPDYQIPV